MDFTKTNPVLLIEKENRRIGLLKKEDIDFQTWLSDLETDHFKEYHFENRKREFIGVRQIRNSLLPNESIVKEPSGKPKLLSDEHHISVSHSKTSVCLGVSSEPIGLDIEEINPRILRVTTKFVNPMEEKFYAIDSEEDLTILWTIKESVYKLCNNKGMSFKNDIIVTARTKNRHTCKVKTSKGERKFFLKHERIEDEILTYNCTQQ